MQSVFREEVVKKEKWEVDAALLLSALVYCSSLLCVRVSKTPWA
jgi:hypothetical protein